uniref:Uncharacterized protein n=1 Tax=Glossina brevipalpis TaxID=37001 RepID=A0A1A9W557_9MUSC
MIRWFELLLEFCVFVFGPIFVDGLLAIGVAAIVAEVSILAGSFRTPGICCCCSCLCLLVAAAASFFALNFSCFSRSLRACSAASGHMPGGRVGLRWANCFPLLSYKAQRMQFTNTSSLVHFYNSNLLPQPQTEEQFYPSIRKPLASSAFSRMAFSSKSRTSSLETSRPSVIIRAKSFPFCEPDATYSCLHKLRHHAKLFSTYGIEEIQQKQKKHNIHVYLACALFNDEGLRQES